MAARFGQHDLHRNDIVYGPIRLSTYNWDNPEAPIYYDVGRRWAKSKFKVKDSAGPWGSARRLLYWLSHKARRNELLKATDALKNRRERMALVEARRNARHAKAAYEKARAALDELDIFS